jgi:hypothetical protein
MEGAQTEAAAVAEQKTPEQVKPASFIASGGDVEHIKVEISYGIIQRFSEGLYSSPNKAFEELVSNSYDAGASSVWIEMPEDLEDASAILVLDNGESMDLAGLHELWKIGKSPKRTGGEDGGERVVNGRDPIGKFGIGKLATYVLADELTYICRTTGGEYLAVTMDYSLVTGDTELSATQPMELKVVSLDENEAQEAVTSQISEFASEEIAKFFENEPDTWTAVVLTKVKDKGASEIQQGMLKWVLRTALPVNPQFELHFRGTELKPSKIDGDRSWEWVVGKDDKGEAAPPTWKYKDGAGSEGDNHFVDLTHAGRVTGKAELFANSLQRGKSEEWGRSHGFFVKVRNRLINVEDAEFGVEVELQHGTFTRFRMEIDADGLDDFVASPRESIQESPARKELRQYLLDVFNRARAKHKELEEEGDADSLAAADRIADAPAALSQKPLRRLLAHAVEDRDPDLLSLFSMDDEADIEEAQAVLDSNENLLGSVEVDDLPDPRRLVGYDPGRRAIVVNATHPFIRNYLGAKGATDVVRDIGAAELLTEAYLLDQDFPSSFVRRFLDRRDALLRALTKIGPRSAPVIAEQLRDSKHSEKELEDAAADALQHLGYEVQRIGGNGKPDGIATARLGRLTKDEAAPSYLLTYDTKSTTTSDKEAIQAATAHTNILKVHRQDVDADHTLLIAPDFQGADDPEKNLGKTCVNDSITPIRVSDFAKLVELIPFRDLTPRKLRDLFSLRLPKATKEFVDALEETPPVPRPVGTVLEVIADYSTKQDAVTIDTINAALNERVDHDFGVEEVESIVRGLKALAPRTLYFENSVVALNASADSVLAEIKESVEPLPDELVQSYEKELEGTAE